MKLLITGTSGFFGRSIAVAALEAGHRVAGVDCRRGAADPPHDLFSGHRIDLLAPGTDLEGLLKDADAVIHAAALIKGPPEAVRRANVEATGLLLDRAAGRKDLRFVLISSATALEEQAGPYGRSKREAEALVEARLRDHVLLRPTMIYGRNDPGWTAQIRKRLQRGFPMVLPGRGRTKIQPVFVEDAARAAVAAAVEGGVSGRAFSLGGPAPVAYGDFLRSVRRLLQAGAPLIPFPLWPLCIAGRLLGGRFAAASAFFAGDHGVDITAARQGLRFEPRSLEEGLPLVFP